MAELQEKNKIPGTLFIFFGPSGVGKTTLAQAVMARMEAHHPGDLVMVRSYTTRQLRLHEQHGVDYWFISPEEFEKKKKEHFFLEYSTAYQASYGSSYQEISRLLETGRSVLMVIDRYGVKQVLDRMPHAITIQIVPSKFDVLRERLHKRADMTEKDVEFRLHVSHNELEEEQYNPLARFIVVNDRLDNAIEDIYKIITHQLYI